MFLTGDHTDYSGQIQTALCHMNLASLLKATLISLSNKSCLYEQRLFSKEIMSMRKSNSVRREDFRNLCLSSALWDARHSNCNRSTSIVTQSSHCI